MLSKFANPRWTIPLLLLGVWAGLLGAFKPVLFNEGSSMAKYIAKQNQLEMVAEEEVENYFEAVLYGEGEVGEVSDAKIIESVSEPERRELVESIFLLDRWIVAILALASLLLLSPKLLEETPIRHVLPVLSVWLIVESIGSTLNGGEPFTHLAVFAHATRWALPLVLWCMVFKPKKVNPEMGKLGSPAVDVASGLTHFIVACTSITFAIHGWEAFKLNPFFQDLIYGFGSLFSLQVSPNVTAGLLKAIGFMDISLAVLILFYRRPEIFLWMAFWGLITALSRPLVIGLDAWAEVPLRAGNFILPLLLFTIHKIPSRSSARTPEYRSDSSHENA